MSPKKMSREDRRQLLLDMGSPVPAHLESKIADVRAGAPGDDRPRCERCGGNSSVGVSGDRYYEFCRACADEHYLEQLTPEERALLRR